MHIRKYPDIFFTADYHLGHEMFIRTGKRPFASVEEQDETIIERHNSRVNRGARVYNLGDVFLKISKEKAEGYARRLYKACPNQFLILGNHDAIAEQIRFGIWQKDLFHLTIKEGINQKIVLGHYAMRTWASSHHGAWQLHSGIQHLPGQLSNETRFIMNEFAQELNVPAEQLENFLKLVTNESWQLYGHSHGGLREISELLSFDVGVDCWDFYPVHIEEIAKKMAPKISAFNEWKAKNLKPIKEMLRDVRPNDAKYGMKDPKFNTPDAE